MKLTTTVLALLVVTLSEGSGIRANQLPAGAPGGRLTLSRNVIRQPINRGIPFHQLTEIEGIGDPWDRSQVAKKFHNSFMTGHRGFSAVGDEQGLILLPRDLLFVIDMSGSISRHDWELTKQKIADLVERLCGTIGRGRQNNRIAVVTFSSEVLLNFDFKTHWSVDSVRRAILGMRQRAGLTCTGDAFRYAHQHMFNPDAGIRSATESVKEVLVLTDGNSNCGADLLINARLLKVKALVFALVIGNFGAAGKAEVESMVSTPLIDHLFSLFNFLEFKDMVETVMGYPDKCVSLELS